MPKKKTETITVKYCDGSCPFYSSDDWGSYCSAGCNIPTGYKELPPSTCPLKKKNIKVIYA